MQFSESELMLMVDALNGVGCSPGTFIGNIQGALTYEDLGAKHNVDVRLLLEKLGEMPLIKIAALHAAIEEFWSAGEVNSAHDRLVEVELLEN